jgi:hypothetical protein
MGDFSKTINFFKKNCFAPFCLSLGLKKPGDFTVSEGHGYPVSEGHGYPLVRTYSSTVKLSGNAFEL